MINELTDDLIVFITSFGDAVDLMRLSQTCRRFGSSTAVPLTTAKPPAAFIDSSHHQDTACSSASWSLMEESARQVIEAAQHYEKEWASFGGGSSWIRPYHELLKLRSHAWFDKLIGRGIRHVNNNKSHVYISLREEQHVQQLEEARNRILHRSPSRGRRRRIGQVQSEGPNLLQLLNGVSSSGSNGASTAVSCAAVGNHIMRAGKHYITFTMTRVEKISFGVIRPFTDEGSTFRVFDPLIHGASLAYGQEEQNLVGHVDCCLYATYPGACQWTDWQRPSSLFTNDWDGMEHALEGNVGLLLDLDAGTLAVYKNGRRLGIMKDGLSGEYSWLMSIQGAYNPTAVEIRRETIPPDA